MNDKRMQALTEDVRWTAEQISRELGWNGGEISAANKNTRKAAA